MSTTRKSGKTAEQAASLKQMEASRVPAAKVGTPVPNKERVCWAAKTLVAEVHEMFPETPVEYSNPDGRNTMLDVVFDLTSLDQLEDRDGLAALLDLIHTDARVAEVISEDLSVLVSFKSNARTQDVRDSFGLADAWDVLTDGYDMGGLTVAVGNDPWDVDDTTPTGIAHDVDPVYFDTDYSDTDGASR